ncbi:MAG: copper homeostasis protein CutC [Bacteroidota bacterium]
MLVEVCANSLQSAINAQKAGADRIELCSELAVGGITPSYGLLQQIKEQVSIPVHVLVRPRSGDFTYSDMDFNIMKADVAHCISLGFDGVVSGVLHSNFTLDVDRTAQLIKIAKGRHFTFHRAFDWVKNPSETLKTLAKMGIDTVLTSGQQKSALEGMALLAHLRDQEASCTIMPGGGIGPKNVMQFKEKGFAEVHLSGTRKRRSLDGRPQVPMCASRLPNDDEIVVTDVETVRLVVEQFKG